MTDSTTQYVDEWITTHRDDIGGIELRRIQTDQYGPTLVWEFETSMHFIQFAAWDHAFCLDIQALNKENGIDDFMVAGSCETISGVDTRLESFLDWIDDEAVYSRAKPSEFLA